MNSLRLLLLLLFSSSSLFVCLVWGKNVIWYAFYVRREREEEDDCVNRSIGTVCRGKPSICVCCLFQGTIYPFPGTKRSLLSTLIRELSSLAKMNEVGCKWHLYSDAYFHHSPVAGLLKSQKTDCSNPHQDLGLIEIQFMLTSTSRLQGNHVLTGVSSYVLCTSKAHAL